jgi:aryl-alcohol dehydrogenase-like predicted oxidoreductase
VGGLMVRGAAAEQERAVARALELGVDYLDTAPAYGDGASEENLGRVLRALRYPPAFGSTKFTIHPGDGTRIGDAIAASAETSLRRLGLQRLDLLQMHNRIARDGGDRALAPELVLGEVVPALERLKREGKIRFCGMTAIGETAALHEVVAAGGFDTAQVVFNLINPSTVFPLPSGRAGAQDFAGLAAKAQARGMGTIGIRILAGGALSGSEERHKIASPPPAPIGSGPDYRADVATARRFERLVAAGHAQDLIEAAVRFAITPEAISTALVGVASLEQFETAAAAALRGPLDAAAIAAALE